ncbi:hypothetical protein C2G38_2113329, partial [Gigaspora rosea]
MPKFVIFIFFLTLLCHISLPLTLFEGGVHIHLNYITHEHARSFALTIPTRTCVFVFFFFF